MVRGACWFYSEDLSSDHGIHVGWLTAVCIASLRALIFSSCLHENVCAHAHMCVHTHNTYRSQGHTFKRGWLWLKTWDKEEWKWCRYRTLVLEILKYVLKMYNKLFFFRDRVSLCNSPGCPGTNSLDQARVEFTEVHLPLPPSAGSKHMCYHTCCKNKS